MTINTIRNAAVRRTLLVLLIVPAVLLTFVWEAAKLFGGLLADVPSVFEHCWRGRK